MNQNGSETKSNGKEGEGIAALRIRFDLLPIPTDFELDKVRDNYLQDLSLAFRPPTNILFAYNYDQAQKLLEKIKDGSIGGG